MASPDTDHNTHLDEMSAELPCTVQGLEDIIDPLRRVWWCAEPYERILYVSLKVSPLVSNQDLSSIQPNWCLSHARGEELRQLAAHYHWVLFYFLDRERAVITAVGAVTGQYLSRLGNRLLRYQNVMVKRPPSSTVPCPLYVRPHLDDSDSIDWQRAAKATEARIEMLTCIGRVMNDRRGLDKEARDRLIQQFYETFSTSIDGSNHALDQVSHFIGRILCSLDEQFLQMFVKGERALLEWRTQRLTPLQQLEVLHQNGCDHQVYCNRFPQDYTLLPNRIPEVERRAPPFRYVVPFGQVPSLITGKGDPVHEGNIYFDPDKFIRWQCDRLNIEIVDGANTMRELFFDTPAEYERQVPEPLAACLPLLMDRFQASVQTQQTNRSRGDIGDLVGDIEGLSLNHFPPCMRRIHQFTNTRHLRFEERRRFAWFLYDAGWTVDEVMRSWWGLWGKANEEYRKMSLEEFQATTYGADVRGLYTASRDPKWKTMACSTMIKSPELRQFCPHADGKSAMGDMEDLMQGCRSACSRRLFPAGDTVLLSPIKHFRVARAQKRE